MAALLLDPAVDRAEHLLELDQHRASIVMPGSHGRRRPRWKRAVLYWFRALEVTPGRTGTYHPHFHVLLIVSAKYFDPGSPFYIGQAEWRVMWEQCLRADGGRIVDIRVTENLGEVAKYVTKSAAYLKLDGDGAWWCDPERLETLHYALGSRRLIAWPWSLSEIRRKLGFLEDDDFDDLVAIDELDDSEGWVPVREARYRWRRNEEGRFAYHPWTNKPIMGFDPDECDHDENWDEGEDHERRLH